MPRSNARGSPWHNAPAALFVDIMLAPEVQLDARWVHAAAPRFTSHRQWRAGES